MSGDLLTMLAWSAFLLASVGATGHLHRHLGVLPASQATVMTLAALVDVLLLKSGMRPVFSWAAGVCSAAALGLLHLPVLYQTGPALLLVLTAVSQMVLVEAWYSFPEVTGGSGGTLLPAGAPWGSTLAGFAVMATAGAGYLSLFATRPAMRFDWECLKALGPKAGACGVPTGRLYVAGFALYGILLGAAGVAATRLLGYLTVTSFGLGWSLAVVMIVLACPAYPVGGAALLALLYSGVRVLLRQSVHASPTWSNLFEIVFPVCLLLVVRIRGQVPDDPGRFCAT